MPKISQVKRQKISEQILAHLFERSPEPQFTAHIATELARDEEFTKDLLLGLEKQKLITQVNKNPKGIQYLRRQRWRLSSNTYEVYKSHQP